MPKVKELEEKIINTIIFHKPKTCENLIDILINKEISKKMVINTLFDLEDMGKITLIDVNFNEKKNYWELIRSSLFFPYYISLIVMISTILLNDGYIKYMTGAIYLILLPGYWFLKCMNMTNINKIKLLPMSMGISISFVFIIGVILNYTTGINQISIISANTILLTVLLIISFMNDRGIHILKRTPNS